MGIGSNQGLEWPQEEPRRRSLERLVRGGSAEGGRAETTARSWRHLAWLWAIYYTVVLTVGRFEAYTGPTLWIGGAIVTAFTLRLLIRRLSDVPSEAWILAALAGWSLLAGLGVADERSYVLYLRLLLECLCVVALLGTVIRISGNVDGMWWAFLAVATFNTWYIVNSGVELSGRGLIGLERQAGLTGNANGLGFYSFTGLLAGMAIFGGTRSILAKALCVAGSVVAFAGLVMSGSRGGYLAWVVAVVLWATTCFGGGKRRVWKVAVGAVAAGLLLYPAIVWIQENTTLGSRTVSSVRGEGPASDDRADLVMLAFDLALENPIAGIGLGQFGRYSGGMAAYAHNEWADFAAATGFPGLLLVLAVYYSVWRRLSRVIAQRRGEAEMYRARTARVTLIILVIAGAVFRPNLIALDTMFLLALVVGVGNIRPSKR